MIINRTKPVSTPSPSIEEAAQAGLWPQMSMMRGALWASPVRNSLLMLATFLFVAAMALPNNDEGPDC